MLAPRGRTLGQRDAIERITGEPVSTSGLRFLELSDDLLVVGDAQRGVIWANSAWERKLGIRREHILGEGYAELIHPDEVAETRRVWRVAAKGDGPADFRTRLRTAEGNYRWFLWSPIFDAEHGLVYGVGKDITELEESQRELEESQRLLAEAQKVSHLGSWEWRPGSGEVFWSEELYRIFEVDPEGFEPTYEAYFALVHPDDRERVQKTIEQLRESGEPASFDHRVQLSGGRDRIVLCRARSEPGDDERIAGTCQDITEIKLSQEELARTVSLHRGTLEATGDGILVVDKEGQIVSLNHKFLEIWRLPEDVMAEGDDAAAVAIAAEQLRDPEGFRARVEELYERSELEAYDVLEFKDGRVVERYCRPQLQDGEIVGRVWSFRDVSDRLRSEREKLDLETRLQQSQRLESLGRLAGGIAHDFNNHLVAIRNYAALAGEELEEGSTARVDLDEVVRAADRAAALTRELLAFSRREEVEPRPLDLNAVVRDAERMLRQTIGDAVELKLALSSELPAVEADPSRVERVLMNLVGNARDAMPDGGTVVVSTASENSEGASEDELSGHLVRITVRDTGTGMTEDVARRALEPFFTTKPRGGGTGLGLATVYGIVNQAGGAMAIDSVAGAGTTITIDFPASAKPPEAAPAPPQPVVAPAGRGTVVVVEDEPPVRRLTARILRDAGFQTLEAAHGEEALEVLEHADPGELRLLLTDLVMPRMSGRELAERVHADHPALPVLIMSGYTDDVIARYGAQSGDASFLSKPFSRDSLLAAVGEVTRV
jgi:two-component system cell cycle sensor histidine kinase/response regulator CckA